MDTLAATGDCITADKTEHQEPLPPPDAVKFYSGDSIHEGQVFLSLTMQA